MVLCKLSLAFVCLLSLALVHPSYAKNSPQDYLNAHNAARAQVGVGPMTWDNNIAAYARRYANLRKHDCNLIHSNGPYGENLAKGSGSFTGTDGVNLWIGEKPYYNYNSNSCVRGKDCLHYTQVIWRNSTRLGCARVQCTNNNWWFVICSYDPRGNYIGQRPY
ncbi:pathogenesis-related leaf protein 6-like [Camellia sinensis]|uniref:SCP domain-containing protein n=1 Tax=Camellia sinensis var. sinensis TaxID=542762 RepID=A0A4V3WMY8_CAMSN|nr:pathogenesis-related leaf protein 6-like [Camellia sinensis]THG10427.1 hypothetical protein TEA_025198 [Camellia sinensis var. sinensis]